jgi:hypothetical protein
LFLDQRVLHALLSARVVPVLLGEGGLGFHDGKDPSDAFQFFWPVDHVRESIHVKGALGSFVLEQERLLVLLLE